MGALWLWVKYPHVIQILQRSARKMLRRKGTFLNSENSRQWWMPMIIPMIIPWKSIETPENHHHVWCLNPNNPNDFHSIKIPKTVTMFDDWTPNSPINPKITMGNCINPREISHRMGLCHKVYLPSGSMEIWRFLARRMAAPTFRTAGQLGSWAWHF